MKKICLIVLLLSVSAGCFAQRQNLAVKTNVLYDATLTLNLGLELGLSRKMTLDISGNANPWKFNNKQWRHYLIQPELRYWTCYRFNGHFFGLHGHAAWYNIGGHLPVVGNMKFFKDRLEDNRYQGFLYGAGLSYGYQWLIGGRWNLEATIGGGFAIMRHKILPLCDCGVDTGYHNKTYWGVTKVGLAFVYMIN